MNMSTSLPWYKCREIDAEKFYNGVSHLERDFLAFFSNELLELIDELLNIANSQKNIVKLVEGTYLPAWARQQTQISQITTQMFYTAHLRKQFNGMVFDLDANDYLVFASGID